MLHLLALVTAGPPLSATLRDHPLVAIGSLFGLGVLYSLSPCIWPMIPITAGILGGGSATATASASRTRTAMLSVTYAAGLALVYAILGLIAGLSGTIFGTVSASPWASLITANLLLLFALVMLDVIPVRVPQRLMAWAGSQGGGSYPAVLLMGASSGIVAAPCGAPAFAVVLTWVAATRSGILGFFYLFAFAFGMTAVLVAVGLFSGILGSLPRAGPWMLWAKRVSAVVVLAMAEYYFIQAGKVW
ncbi:MAG TPA: cytochrome c biogenesis protein CcdA [Gemmatimonadales bacterium]|nr:cytochrome c biogenesis protein CcdA [Gemmatimonadales bacterium]